MTKNALKPQNLLLFVTPFLAALAIVSAQSLPKPQQLAPKTGVLTKLKHKVSLQVGDGILCVCMRTLYPHDSQWKLQRHVHINSTGLT